MFHGERARTEALIIAGALVAAIIVSIAAITRARAEPQQVFRDASGRTIGTAARSGNQTTFRDASGRTTGTATTDSQGTTVFRDSRGRTTGTTTAPFGKEFRR